MEQVQITTSLQAARIASRRAPVTHGVELRPHQAEAVRKVFAGLRQGHSQQLIVLPTGGGKTILACQIVKRLGGRALFIVHTDEIVRQTVKTLQQFAPPSAIGIVKGSLDEGDKRIVVASVQSLRNPKRLRKLAKDFRVVVWDECHHAQAQSYQRVRRHLSKPQTLHIGLTATPWRLDGKSIDALFPHKAVHYTITDGVQGGWLSNVVGKLVYLKDADLRKLKLAHGDFKPSELELVMRAANWDEHVARAYFEHAGKRKTVVFVPTVAMAHQLAQRINEQGGKAEAVDGQMSTEKRRDIVARLSSGQLQVVVNCAVLTEGFDDPLIECVVMARPTASWALYVQCVGRGLRPVKDKTCLVLDVVGATRRHNLVSFPQFAKREGLPNGGRPGARGEQDEIAPLSAEQEALWVDLLEEKAENPACLYCGDRTEKKGRIYAGNQTFLCIGCRKSFTLTPEGKQTSRSASLREAKPICVYCKGRTRKGGKARNGKRGYQCRECFKYFTLAPDGKPSSFTASLLQPNPPCVYCKGKTRKGKTSRTGSKQYHCVKCRKSFTLTPDEVSQLSGNSPVTQPNPQPVTQQQEDEL